MIRRVRVKGFELVRIFHGSEFRNVERAIRRELYPQHVVNSDERYHCAHQVWVLGDHRSHEQAAVAPAEASEFLRIGPLLVDQISGSRCEIIDHGLFFGEVARFMPFLAEFTAAANICDNVGAAAVVPKSASEIKVRREADSIAAVAVE